MKYLNYITRHSPGAWHRNHLLPWETVKKLLKEAWQEGYDAGGTDESNCADIRDGYAYYDDYEETPNPYDEEDD